MVGHPVELPAMRADGSEFPVEIAITRPRCRAAAVHRLPARHHRAQARRAGAALAGRRAGRAAPGRDDRRQRAGRGRVFAVVTEEVGRLLGAESANMVRYEPDGPALVAGAWSDRGRAQRAGGPRVDARRPDGDRADPPQRPAGAGRQLRGPARHDRGDAARPRLPVGGRRADQARRAACGAHVMVSTVEDQPFPAGLRAADRRLRRARSRSRSPTPRRARARGVARPHRRDGDAERRRLERNLPRRRPAAAAWRSR